MSEFLIPSFFIASTAVLGAGLRWSLMRRRPLPALIFAICLLYEVIFVDMPMAFSVMTGYSLERQMQESVEPGDLAIVLLGEMVYVVGLTATLVLCESMRSRKTVATEVQINPNALRLLMVLGCLGAIIATITLLLPVQTIDEGKQHMLVRTYSGPADIIATWVMAGFACSGLYAGGVLFAAPLVNRIGRILGVAAVAPVALLGLLTGIRGRIIWAVMSVLVSAIVFRAKGQIKIALWGLIISLPFFAAMGNLDFRFMMAMGLGGRSLFEALPLLTKASELSFGGGSQSMGEGLVSRAMAVRNSVVLYRLYDQGNGCGMAAISSSLYLPIPRMLWPGKRPAGSCDSTEIGGAMYQVMGIGHGSPYWVMGPYLASAHAYYEGGWILVLLFGPLAGVLWSLICSFAERKPMAIAIVYIMIFLSAFTPDGFFTGIAPIHEFIRTMWLAFVPLLLLDKCMESIVVRHSRRRRPTRLQLSRARTSGEAKA